jgi:predicted HNH restriction endonuclease
MSLATSASQPRAPAASWRYAANAATEQAVKAQQEAAAGRARADDTYSIDTDSAAVSHNDGATTDINGVPVADGGSDAQDNIWTVCSACHAIIHALRRMVEQA